MMKRPPEEKEKWLEGIDKEFKDFNTRQVWVIIKKADLPPNRRLIGTKWVFKCKRDGK
jgi:hypothetical protein